MNETDQKKLYASIRKDNAEQILKDGGWWWFMSGGMPSVRLPTTDVPEMVRLLKDLFKVRGMPPNEPGLVNILSQKRYDWDEMQVLAKSLE